MQLIFSDAQFWGDFLPLTYTKPIAELRTGILTFSERWQKLLDSSEVSYITSIIVTGKQIGRAHV